jgi:hypothetical protein
MPIKSLIKLYIKTRKPWRWGSWSPVKTNRLRQGIWSKTIAGFWRPLRHKNLPACENEIDHETTRIFERQSHWLEGKYAYSKRSSLFSL